MASIVASASPLATLVARCPAHSDSPHSATPVCASSRITSFCRGLQRDSASCLLGSVGSSFHGTVFGSASRGRLRRGKVSMLEATTQAVLQGQDESQGPGSAAPSSTNAPRQETTNLDRWSEHQASDLSDLESFVRISRLVDYVRQAVTSVLCRNDDLSDLGMALECSLLGDVIEHVDHDTAALMQDLYPKYPWPKVEEQALLSRLSPALLTAFDRIYAVVDRVRAAVIVTSKAETSAGASSLTRVRPAVIPVVRLDWTLIRRELRACTAQLRAALESAVEYPFLQSYDIRKSVEKLKSACMDLGILRPEGTPSHASIPNFSPVMRLSEGGSGATSFQAWRECDWSGWVDNQKVAFWRGGQPDEDGVEWLISHGFRSVVDVRGKDSANHWVKNEVAALLASSNIKVYTIPVLRGGPPTNEQFQELMSILNNMDNHPLLLYSMSGLQRPGEFITRWRRLCRDALINGTDSPACSGYFKPGASEEDGSCNLEELPMRTRGTTTTTTTTTVATSSGSTAPVTRGGMSTTTTTTTTTTKTDKAEGALKDGGLRTPNAFPTARPPTTPKKHAEPITPAAPADARNGASINKPDAATPVAPGSTNTVAVTGAMSAGSSPAPPTEKAASSTSSSSSSSSPSSPSGPAKQRLAPLQSQRPEILMQKLKAQKWKQMEAARSVEKAGVTSTPVENKTTGKPAPLDAQRPRYRGQGLMEARLLERRAGLTETRRVEQPVPLVEPSINRLVTDADVKAAQAKIARSLNPLWEPRLSSPKAEMYLVRTDGFTCTRERVLDSTLRFTHPTTQQHVLMWKSKPSTVLLLKKLGDELMEETKEVARWLREEGMRVVVEPDVHDKLAAIPGFDFVETYTLEHESTQLHQLIDFVLCLGGDGVILHASTIFETAVPPVISFNLGSLGFLTSHQYEDFKQDVHDVIYGDPVTDGVFITLRMRLSCTICYNDTPIPGKTFTVMNEVVIDRGASPYLSKVECYESGRLITKVQADGVLLATPTGSTAYSVAAGGSMVHPNVPCILFTPICPHSLSFRPVILPDSANVQLKVPQDARSTAWVCFDGKKRQQLMRGYSVQVRMSEFPMPTINKNDQTGDWFGSLVRCLNWNERMEQKAFMMPPPN
eukprot:jgi/Mesvir1/18056/Mv09370-RA.1